MSSAKALTHWRAPGRVNLIGDHTDYAQGLALPLAIDRDCSVTVAPRPAGAKGSIRAVSKEFAGEVTITTSTRATTSGGGGWGRFVIAAVELVQSLNSHPVNEAIDITVSSTVPAGSGLSSSSALSVALVGALADYLSLPLSKSELAKAAHQVEERATGVPSGLMDQLASVNGEVDHALLIDFATELVNPVKWPDDLAIIVINSGMLRALKDSEYAQRREEVENAARQLGLGSLRLATKKQVADNPWARHVVSENERVLAFVSALQSGSYDDLGLIMGKSHASLRDDFLVSTPELNELVANLISVGAIGARLTGAGFGGCVVALAKPDRADEIAHEALARYRQGASPAIRASAHAFRVRSASGAGPVGERDNSSGLQ